MLTAATPPPAYYAWKKALAAAFNKDYEEFNRLGDELFADDVVFLPPTYLKARKGKQFTKMALMGVSVLFKDFVYKREFIGPRDIALEFECRCGEGGPVLHGIDLIELNETGDKIVKFAVMGRPPNAVQKILEHQSKFLKDKGML